MIARSKTKNAIIALSGAILLGAFTQIAPAQARHWDGWGGYNRHVIVHHHVVHRPRAVVRRVVIVERPYYARVHSRYGWRHHVGHRPGWAHHRWHDRPRCWLPERYLCR